MYVMWRMSNRTFAKKSPRWDCGLLLRGIERSFVLAGSFGDGARIEEFSSCDRLCSMDA